jgi:hypothetical protein
MLPTVPIHDRLWLTAIPKKATDTVGVLTIVRASESRQYGWMFKGSLWRGVYDTFHWAPDGEHGPPADAAGRQGLQGAHRERARPSKGFHYCVLDPRGPAGRRSATSRARCWGLTRPKAKLLGVRPGRPSSQIAGGRRTRELATALAELTAVDPEAPALP